MDKRFFSTLRLKVPAKEAKAGILEAYKKTHFSPPLKEPSLPMKLWRLKPLDSWAEGIECAVLSLDEEGARFLASMAMRDTYYINWNNKREVSCTEIPIDNDEKVVMYTREAFGY